MSIANAAMAGDWFPPGRVWPVGGIFPDQPITITDTQTTRLLEEWKEWRNREANIIPQPVLTSPEKSTTVPSTFKERKRKLSLDDEV